MKSIIIAVVALLLVALPSSVSAAPQVSKSYNWSGYVAKGGGYTNIEGSWTVAPGYDTKHSMSANAAWIGIGGFDGTNNLIQTGTRTLKWNGKITYKAWYELLPAPPVSFSLVIRPGDVVKASIVETSTHEWTITLRNQTTGKSESVAVYYKSNKSSAEWVVERPSSNGTLVALTPFDEFSFFGVAAIRNGKAVTPVTAAAKKLTLIERNGTPVLTPSSLARDGKSFTIARNSSDTLGTPPRLAIQQ